MNRPTVKFGMVLAGLGLACVSLGLPVSAAGAATVELFESPEPTWRIVDDDCGVRVIEHARTFDEAHSGRGCERLRLRTGQGTYVHLAHDVTPARVIAELTPRVWVKADRPGLQLYARAVLPRSRQPDGKPLTALLPGSSYRDVGMWRQLQVTDIQRQLDRQVWMLRHQHGSQVDAREAYIDMLVLNAYGGAGPVQLFIDDLELAGFASTGTEIQLAAFQAESVAPAPVSLESLPAATPTAGVTASAVRLEGSVLTAGDRPLFARVIEHRGESLETLAQLGFNTIRLASAPTATEAAEAKRLGVWLISPPSGGQMSAGAITEDRVIGWMLGDGLTRVELPRTRALAVDVRRASGHGVRPLVAIVEDGFGDYAETSDIVVLSRQTLGTSFPLLHYGSWLRESVGRMRRTVPFWAAVESEFPAALVAQITAMGGSDAARPAVEPLQVQLLAAEAVAAGARGLYFPSSSRLDAADSSTRLRAVTLALVNAQLSLAEPWAAGGSFSEEPAAADPLLRVRVLETQRARLLVATQHAPHQQLVAGPWRTTPSAFVLHSTPITDQAFLIGPTRLEPLRGERAGGVRLGLEATQAVSLALLTQEPLAINFVRRRLAETSAASAATHQQLAALMLARTVDIDRQLAAAGSGQPSSEKLLARAQSETNQIARLQRAGDAESVCRLTDEVLRTLYHVRRSHWERAVRPLGSPLASPLAATFDSLPQHGILTSQMSTTRWGPNLLAGGDFEDLDHLRQCGWVRSAEVLQPGIRTDLSLSFQSPRSGRTALRMQAWSDSDPGTALDDWPLSITSAPVQVRPGQLVRIQGWINVTGAIHESQEGLLVVDSLGGLPLAERFYETKGWQEFSLYRMADRFGELTLTVVLTGLGEVWLDDLTVTVRE